MKRTDYASIANRYDQNPYRIQEIRYDHDLKNYIDRNSKSGYQVLDLSCGTGLYLKKQVDLFKDLPISWHGLDLSEEMLNRSRDRLDHVDFVKADVMSMPYPSNTFDFISNNYAFHHYSNKEKAISEIYRVLMNGGVYKLHNIAIHDMPNWWVYQYFPSAYHEDLKRYWTKETIFHELNSRGFNVNIHVEYKLQCVRLYDYIQYAENRDISVLSLIDDDSHKEGLQRMKEDLLGNPEKTIINDFAELFCIAVKAN